MGDYNKGGGFRGKNTDRGGTHGKPFGRPGVGDGKRFGGSSAPHDGRPRETFRATCDSCGASCEVPFRPTGERPVYCRECFAKNGGPARAPHAPGRTFGAPQYERFTPRHTAPTVRHDGAELASLKKQLEAVNAKLDKVLSFMEKQTAAEKHADVKEALTKATTPEDTPAPKKKATPKAKPKAAAPKKKVAGKKK